MLPDPTTNIIIVIQHTVTSLIGIVGNVLVLIVYKKRLRDNETITFFIVHLALTDLACCLFLIPINCYHELNIGAITSDFMCKFHSFLNIVNITYSCLLMTLVAFERCFSIVYPFKRIVTKSRAKIVMTCLFVFCFSIALISCLGIGIYHRVLFGRINFSNVNVTIPNYDDLSIPNINGADKPSMIMNNHLKSQVELMLSKGTNLNKRHTVSDYGFVLDSTR